MPVPFFNVLNGGVHSGNKMAFQETMFAPVGASSIAEAIQMGSEVYQELKRVITESFGPSGKLKLTFYASQKASSLTYQIKRSELEMKEASLHQFRSLMKH